MIDTADQCKRELRDAKKATLASQAELHRSRAKMARLIANQEEQAAENIHARMNGKNVASGKIDSSKPIQPFISQLNSETKTQFKKESQKQEVGTAESKQSSSAARTSEDLEDSLSANSPQKRSKKRTLKRLKKRRGSLHALAERLTDWLGRRPPWMVSLASHGMLILLLFLLTFASLQEEPFILTATIAETDDWAPEVPVVQLVNWEENVIDPSESLPELIELDTPVEMPSIEPLVSLVETDLAFESDLEPSAGLMTTEVPTQMASQTNNTSSGDSSNQQAIDGKVEFFGVTEEASRVVFVVDNSGSMQRGRMETTLDELNRAVQRLKPDQKFYVIFYSDQAYPMFYPDSIETLQFATRDNKKKLAKWLRTIEICLGGRLLDAVEMASSFDPQVVFLMSDGDIRSQRVMQSLTNVEEWDFTIHTFGMEVRTKKHADNLGAIAEANGGLFNVVDVRPKAIRRSMAKPIPYNRQPGEVWGSMVTVWN